MNKARVHFRYTSPSEGGSSSLELYGNSDDCHRCTLLLLRPLDCPSTSATCTKLFPNTTYDFDVNGVYPMRLDLRSDEKTTVWSGKYAFVEMSDYSMQAQQLESGEVHTTFALNSEGSPWLILTILFVSIGLWLTSCLGWFFWKKHLVSLRSDDEEDSLEPLLLTETKVASRVESLDVFRGITIVTMIFVNYGGGGYWLFNHSTWNGITIADLVFPWFAWTMGMSMSIGFAKKRFSRLNHFRIASIRALKLFALGLFLNNGYDLTSWRIPGVLQSFGVSYFIVSSIILGSNSIWLIQIISMASIAVLQSLVVFFLPVRGCPTGYLGPGGIGDYGKYPNCTGGAHRAVDLALFGHNHIFGGPTTKDVYSTSSYDPEGFLNWFMVALTTFLGYVAGSVVLTQPLHWRRKTIIMSGSGLVLLILGLVLCQGRVNDGWIPLNKNMWSLSFVLTTTGLASLVFTGVFLLVDVFHIWTGGPFVYAGMNAILLYCGHELLQSFFPFGLKHDETSHVTTTLANLLGVFSWLCIARFLHAKKIFITV
ncbi:hypothetical protein LEN26_014097 [Aphanomyces euteiches]|nr:hypothetical protein AeMF1_021498 [Aphanomyces euteiches]KAH9108977.1 hypothetical protein LEN26_014097 [Aphanomyces euteiches]KAH9196900.1 hypothetical protein AeNC1_001103 [Aphanomyces euteiches]